MSKLQHAKELVMALSPEDRESIYQMLLGDHVKADALSILKLRGYDVPPEEERDEFAKSIAEVYVFRGGRNDDVPYNSTLSELVDSAVEDYIEEHGRYVF